MTLVVPPRGTRPATNISYGKDDVEGAQILDDVAGIAASAHFLERLFQRERILSSVVVPRSPMKISSVFTGLRLDGSQSLSQLRRPVR